MKIPKNLQDRVEEIYHDDDGWWAVLKDGWELDGCCGIREDTKRDLLSRCKDARRGETY